MKDPLKKITLVFLIIAVLPVAFIVYELTLLNRNESMVRETYKGQLDAILYSVNQYSDDIISSWANRVRLELQKENDTTDISHRFQMVLNQSDVVGYVYLTDLNGNSSIFSLTDKWPSPAMELALNELAKKEMERLERLIKYEEAGFRKMEGIDFIVEGNSIPVFFALDRGTKDYKIGALVIDLRSFIRNTLSPKMQTISQGKFVISALQTKNDSVIYTTELTASSADIQRAAQVFKEELQTREFWVLPGYYLGITLQGATTDDLVKDRSRTSLAILVLFGVLLGGGILFLYRNIRKEMQLSQAKSEFVSNVSHEIRTPLSLIGMFAETLEAGRVTTEEKKKEYYSIISKEASRLSRIVNRILNFSQLEANKKTFHFAPVQLNDLCKEVLANYTDHLKEKGFVVDLVEDRLPAVRGDREAISEVFINLLDNAVKYSRDKKRITIKTESGINHVYLSVSDEGIGIAREHQREIFEQFFRAPLGDVHTTKGSGLGLTLVKKIMLAHKGDVTVVSEPGKGSTFRLMFPIEKEMKS